MRALRRDWSRRRAPKPTPTGFAPSVWRVGVVSQRRVALLRRSARRNSSWPLRRNASLKYRRRRRRRALVRVLLSNDNDVLFVNRSLRFSSPSAKSLKNISRCVCVFVSSNIVQIADFFSPFSGSSGRPVESRRRGHSAADQDSAAAKEGTRIASFFFCVWFSFVSVGFGLQIAKQKAAMARIKGEPAPGTQRTVCGRLMFNSVRVLFRRFRSSCDCRRARLHFDFV